MSKSLRRDVSAIVVGARPFQAGKMVLDDAAAKKALNAFVAARESGADLDIAVNVAVALFRQVQAAATESEVRAWLLRSMATAARG